MTFLITRLPDHFLGWWILADKDLISSDSIVLAWIDETRQHTLLQMLSCRKILIFRRKSLIPNATKSFCIIGRGKNWRGTYALRSSKTAPLISSWGPARARYRDLKRGLLRTGRTAAHELGA